MKLITLDYFVFTGSCQWKTKSDPYVQEEKKDLDRIICATKCAKNQDLTVNIKSVLEKKTLPGLLSVSPPKITFIVIILS